ncbi:MAG: hypothetical protein ACR2NU_07770 [Aeoliella sp.]
MSTPHRTYAQSTRPWLQPVVFGPERYREFVESLNADLADLEAEHATPRSCLTSRQSLVNFFRQGISDTRSRGNSEQASP